MAAEQGNGSTAVDDVGTPFGSYGALDASSPLMSTPIQACVAPLLLHTSGMSTEPLSDAHCTVPPLGVEEEPKLVMVGATTVGGAVVDADVVLGFVVVGGVLLALDELRVVAEGGALDDLLEVDSGGATAAALVVPDAVGAVDPDRATR